MGIAYTQPRAHGARPARREVYSPCGAQCAVRSTARSEGVAGRPGSGEVWGVIVGSLKTFVLVDQLNELLANCLNS